MAVKLFLGGTCNDSKWREKFISIIDNKVDYFNPVVDNWDEEAQEKEDIEKGMCSHFVYTITPKMTGVFSIAEVVDDSNKRPERTVLCILTEDDGSKFTSSQIKSLKKTAKMVKDNGAKIFFNLEDMANHFIQ